MALEPLENQFPEYQEFEETQFPEYVPTTIGTTAAAKTFAVGQVKEAKDKGLIPKEEDPIQDQAWLDGVANDIRPDIESFLQDMGYEALKANLEQKQAVLETTATQDMDEAIRLIRNLDFEAQQEAFPFVHMARKRFPGAEDDFVQSYAFLMQTAYKFTQMDDDQSAAEKAWNHVAMFFLPLSFYQVGLGDSTNFTSDGLSRIDHLSGEEKLQLFPSLVAEAIKISDGNSERAQAYLADLFTPGAGENRAMEQILEVLGFGLSATDLAVLGTRIFKTLNRPVLTMDELLEQALKSAELSADQIQELRAAFATRVRELGDERGDKVIGPRENRARIEPLGVSGDNSVATALFNSIQEKIAEVHPISFKNVIDGVSGRAATPIFREMLTQAGKDSSYLKLLTALDLQFKQAIIRSSPLKADPVAAEKAYFAAAREAAELYKSKYADDLAAMEYGEIVVRPFADKDGSLGWEILKREYQTGYDPVLQKDMLLLTDEKMVTKEVWKPTLNEITGTMELPAFSKVAEETLSRTAILDGEEMLAVFNAAQVAMGQQARLKFLFDSAVAAARLPIRGKNKLPRRGYWKSRKKVDHLLTVGDETRRIFKREDVVQTNPADRGFIDPSVVPTNSRYGRIRKLTEQEYESYLLHRGLMDYAWYAEENLLYRALRLNGYSSINGIKSIDGSPVVGKAATTSEKIRAKLDSIRGEAREKGLRTEQIEQIYDLETKKFISVDELAARMDVEDFDAAGYALVDTNGYMPWRLPASDASVSRILTKTRTLGDVPKTGLKPYRAGYIPKHNLGGEFAVIIKQGQVVNNVYNPSGGKKLLGLTTRRDNAQLEATRWNLDPANLRLGTAEVLDDYEAVRSILQPSELSSAGLHRGWRSEDQITVNGRLADRAPAGASIQHRLDLLSRVSAYEDWKSWAEELWVNSVNANPQIKTKVKHIDDPILLSEGDAGRRAEWVREMIKSTLLLQSAEERAFQRFTRQVGIWSEDAVFMPEFGTKFAYWLSHKDPWNAAKSVAFHAYLGVMNFGQAFVQAQIASIAVSAHPLYGTKAIAEALPLTMAVMNRNRNTVDMLFDAGRNISKDNFFYEDFAILADSGFLDTTLMTGEFRAAMAGRGYGWDTFKDIMNKGLMPYQVGETYGRVVSYLVAKAELEAAGKITKVKNWKKKGVLPYQTEDLNKIYTLANKYALNINSLNKAKWQDGILGLSTQFLQVQAKFAEALFGKWFKPGARWSPKEKAMLALGQMAIYGPTAGLVFGEPIVKGAATWLDLDPNELAESHPHLVDYVRQGIFGVITGGELATATRSSVASGLYESFELALAGGKAPVALFFGAFGALVGQYGTALGTLHDVATSEVTTFEDVTLAAAEVLTSLASSSRNAHLAWYMHTRNQYFRTNNIPVAEEFSTLEKLGTLIGIKPQLLSDLPLEIQTERERKEKLEKIADDVFNMYTTMLKNRDNPEAYNAALRAIAYMTSGSDYDGIVVSDIFWGKLRRSFTEGDGILERMQRNEFNEAATKLLPKGDPFARASVIKRVQKSDNDG